MFEDTIVAIATAPGEAGLAVVRISGRASRQVLERIFVPTRGGSPRPRRLTHGWVLDPQTRQRVDEVLAVWLPGAATYTGEHSAEVHCHGGDLSPRRVLEAALAAGARPAEPGEFTLRAFLNGRLDLAQAEAILDVVRSRSERARQLALRGLAGRLSTAIRALRERLLGAQAYLEASLDFAEEDLPEQDVQPDLATVLDETRRLLDEASQGLVYRGGLRIAIVGRPNAGKSSLLNALLRSERAIVTDIPGTTRDTVEESAVLGEVPFWLVDTAGLRPARDAVERLGVERTRSAIETADLRLLVVDWAAGRAEAEWALAELGRQPDLVALNKSDLAPGQNAGWRLPLPPEVPQLPISALHGDGLARLEQALVDRALGGQPVADPRVDHPRHREALARTETALRAALAALNEGQPADLVASEVGRAVRSLGEITGQNATEDLLDAIFGRFCLGK